MPGSSRVGTEAGLESSSPSWELWARVSPRRGNEHAFRKKATPSSLGPWHAGGFQASGEEIKVSVCVKRNPV